MRVAQIEQPEAVFYTRPSRRERHLAGETGKSGINIGTAKTGSHPFQAGAVRRPTLCCRATRAVSKSSLVQTVKRLPVLAEKCMALTRPSGGVPKG